VVVVSIFSVPLRLRLVVANKRLEDDAYTGDLVLVVLAPGGAVDFAPPLGVAPAALFVHLLPLLVGPVSHVAPSPSSAAATLGKTSDQRLALPKTA
jgi:hypothetical protein